MNKVSDEQSAEISRLNGEAAVLECQLAAKNYAINKIIDEVVADD
jgi:hypothetical protein